MNHSINHSNMNPIMQSFTISCNPFHFIWCHVTAFNSCMNSCQSINLIQISVVKSHRNIPRKTFKFYRCLTSITGSFMIWPLFISFRNDIHTWPTKGSFELSTQSNLKTMPMRSCRQGCGYAWILSFTFPDPHIEYGSGTRRER